VTFGALYIKQKLGLTDEETVHQIRENASIQYFLGFAGYVAKAPFDPSMMVHFRKRFSDDDIRRINELVVQRGKDMLLKALAECSDDNESDGGQPNDRCDQLAIDELIKPLDWPKGKNWGTLTIDASCMPADIANPRDLRLLDEVRLSTERIIDELCNQATEFKRHRPRYDRGMVHAHVLRIAKQKRPRRRRVKAAIKRQLDYLQQNSRAVNSLIACGAMLCELKRHWWQKLLACRELERQQSWMLMNKTNSIPDRLVNVVQRHVRPIVRGKARTPVEFGAKISVSVQNGFPFLHRISWNPYNDGADLIEQSEKYKRDTGSYPERICADQVSITTKNHHYCTRYGIRITGKRLGRPSQNPDVTSAQVRQLRVDQGRRDEVEGVFGSGKRKYSLDRIMARRKAGAKTSISMTCLVMCAEKVLRLIRLFFNLILGLVVVLLRPWLDLCVHPHCLMPAV